MFPGETRQLNVSFHKGWNSLYLSIEAFGNNQVVRFPSNELEYAENPFPCYVQSKEEKAIEEEARKAAEELAYKAALDSRRRCLQ